MSEPNSNTRGGFRAFACFGVNSLIEQMCTTTIAANITVYLIQGYHMSSVYGSNVVFVWNALSSFLQMAGAFLADSCLGCFPVLGVGSVIYVGGMLVLCSTAFFVEARPPCDRLSCQPPTMTQLVWLYPSLFAIAVGIGGMRPCSSFGTDQLTDTNDWRKSVFSRFVDIANMVALTLMVSLPTLTSWFIGFLLPAGLMIVGTVVFLSGSSIYIKLQPGRNILTSLVRVVCVAFRKRNVQAPVHGSLPQSQENDWYLYSENSSLHVPSNKLRFLNKACTKSTHTNYERICHVEEVEELKSLLRVLPIWLCGIVFSMAINQRSFGVQQALTMDRHLGKFEIPAGSFGAFELLASMLVQIIYERVFAPMVHQRMSHRFRVGSGLLFSCIANFLAGRGEQLRRRRAFEENHLIRQPFGAVHMSAMLLIPQFVLTGMASGLATTGLSEFFKSQFPSRMKNIASSLSASAVGCGYVLGCIVFNLVHGGSSHTAGWIGDTLNQSHLHSYYFLLGYLSVAIWIMFLIFAWLYGPETLTVWNEETLVGGPNEGLQLVTVGGDNGGLQVGAGGLQGGGGGGEMNGGESLQVATGGLQGGENRGEERRAEGGVRVVEEDIGDGGGGEGREMNGGENRGEERRAEGGVVEEDIGDGGGGVVGVVLTVIGLLFLVLVWILSLVDSLLD